LYAGVQHFCPARLYWAIARKRRQYTVQYTENLGLNQWEASDRIQHSDFNADNVKLDAAILGRLEITKLLEVVPTAASNTILLDVSQIAFPDWQIVAMETTLKGSAAYRIGLQANEQGASAGYSATGSNSSNTGSLLPLNNTADGSLTELTLFFPLRSSVQKLYACVFSADRFYYGYDSGVAFSALQSLKLAPYSTTQTLLSGGKITLWGVK
jgi:hypothetical protein